MRFFHTIYTFVKAKTKTFTSIPQINTDLLFSLHLLSLIYVRSLYLHSCVYLFDVTRIAGDLMTIKIGRFVFKKYFFTINIGYLMYK